MSYIDNSEGTRMEVNAIATLKEKSQTKGKMHISTSAI